MNKQLEQAQCRDSLVVRTLRCGRSNPGSNPGHGKSWNWNFFSNIYFLFLCMLKKAKFYFLPSHMIYCWCSPLTTCISWADIDFIFYVNTARRIMRHLPSVLTRTETKDMSTHHVYASNMTNHLKANEGDVMPVMSWSILAVFLLKYPQTTKRSSEYNFLFQTAFNAVTIVFFLLVNKYIFIDNKYV